MFWFWAEAENFPKSPGWGVTPKKDLESYHATITPMDTQKNHLKKDKLRFFLWICYQFCQVTRTGCSQQCERQHRSSLQQGWALLGAAAGICPCVAALQRNDSLSLCISGKLETHSPTWKPAAFSGKKSSQCIITKISFVFSAFKHIFKKIKIISIKKITDLLRHHTLPYLYSSTYSPTAKEDLRTRW